MTAPAATADGQPPARVDNRRRGRGSARGRLLDAAVEVIRRQGLSGTSVEDLCAAAGVTKGAFFHHFPSKEALAVAAVDHWTQVTSNLFDSAPYHDQPNAAQRVLAYVDFRAAMIGEEPAKFSCLAGTMVQESFDTHPAIRKACGENILGHAATLEADIDAALREAGREDIDPASLARYLLVVVQGAFVVAKAGDNPQFARESFGHLRRYLQGLFAVPG